MQLNPFRRRREKALESSAAVVEGIRSGNTFMPIIGGHNWDRNRINGAYVETQAASYAYLYRVQPAVRAVIDYIARNVEQLGLKLYERASDTDRREQGDHAAARLMRRPNPRTTGGDFVRGFVSDYLVYENAYALKLRVDAELALVRLPPYATGIIGASRFAVEGYRIWRSDGTFFDVSPDDVIHWSGYDPDDPRRGVSKLETLREILAEEAASQTASVELMKSGLGQTGHIERPLEAPEWSEEARRRFMEDWANQRKAQNRRHPVLEEGMEFKPAGVSPKEAEMLGGRKFTREEVARQYGLAHCPPEGADERKQFYADVLPPLTGAFEEVLGLQLLEAEYGAADDLYFEFNLAEKLRGEVEERFKTLVSAAGGPILTRNEARARENLEALPDGEELITPLNVVVGGKPSPQVMPPQNPLGPEQDGSGRDEDEPPTKAIEPRGKALVQRRESQRKRRDAYALEHEQLLRSFFARQERTLKSRQLEEKAVSDARWERELSDDLEKLARRQVKHSGDVAAERLGAGSFDEEQVRNYLKAAAAGKAAAINRATVEALAEGDADEVFANAKDVRAVEAGMTIATALDAFAQKEAAKQAPDSPGRLKRWLVNSSNSRHPEMDGDVAPLYGTFSNGEDLPGAEPGCQCTIEIV